MYPKSLLSCSDEWGCALDDKQSCGDYFSSETVGIMVGVVVIVIYTVF